MLQRRNGSLSMKFFRNADIKLPAIGFVWGLTNIGAKGQIVIYCRMKLTLNSFSGSALKGDQVANAFDLTVKKPILCAILHFCKIALVL